MVLVNAIERQSLNQCTEKQDGYQPCKYVGMTVLQLLQTQCVDI